MMFKIIIGLVVVGVIGSIVLSPSSSDPKVKGAAQVMTFNTIQAEINQGGQIIDVRTAAEYKAGYIDGAVNLPVQDIQNNILPKVAKDKPVYVYCQSGNRSSQAKAMLKKAGYQQVIDLGAIKDVQSMGGSIKR